MNARQPGSLARFQDRIARALLGEVDCDLTIDEAAVVHHPAFAVYRNGVMKSAIDALQGNYPAVVRLVGEEWFRAAAAVHVRASPPRCPVLVAYGADFADFLACFEPAAELPYLCEVARLDRMWTEAHIGEDAVTLDAACIVAASPEQLAQMVLRPHPCARWAWFPTAPIYSLWSRNRGAEDALDELDWIGEGVLIGRPTQDVRWQPLDQAGCAFLDRCAAGDALASATGAALDIDPHADLALLMSKLLTAGALSAPSVETLPEGDLP